MHQAKHASIKLNGQDYDGSNPAPIQAPANIDGVISKPRPLELRVVKHADQQPLPSRTLMRHAVVKPAKSAKLIESVRLPLKSPLITAPPMVGRVDPKLAKRAQSFRPSQAISRFGATLKSVATPTYLSDPAPQTNDDLIADRATALAQTAGATLLERAVDNATSHEQPKLSRKELKAVHGKRKAHGRSSAIILVSIMGVLTLAYGIYANMPNVMVKVASVRAGFSAVMPSYRPSGYSLTSVNYQPSTVSFNFTSNIDSRKFTLTEHSSNWDSATLLASAIVPAEGSNYQELTLSGQSVYLYGSDQASWVSNGILYQVNGNNSLSTNQMLKLATTL